MAKIKWNANKAGKGAAAGAAAGSVLPGVGTTVGAVGGGLIGGVSENFGGATGSALGGTLDKVPNPADWLKSIDPTRAMSTHEEDKAARAALDKIIAGADGLQVPELQDVQLEDQEYLGDFTPEQLAAAERMDPALLAAPERLSAQTVDALGDVDYRDAAAERAALTKMGRSAFEDIKSDPALRDAQMASLGKLDEIIAGGGMTARERANMERVRSDVNAADRGRRDAILQNMASRGMGGSGMELLAALDSGQAATDREAQAGLDQAAAAEERALEAIMQKGQMAGSMRGQDFDQASRVAQAHDAIDQFNAAAANSMSQFNTGAANDMTRFNTGNKLNTALANRAYTTDVGKFNAGSANDMARFNVGNTIDVGKFNAGATNDAARFNIGNTMDVNKTNVAANNAAGMAGWQAKQGIANANTDTRNKQTIYNTTEKPKAQFGMNAQKQAGMTDAYGKEVDFWTKAGDRKASKGGAMLGGGASIVGGLLSYAASDERTKTDVNDITDADLDEFFAALKPKTFRYKDRYANGDDGQKAGFMMQDIEGTKVGDVIGRDGPDGMKAYDPQALQGVILAALKKLSGEKG